MLRCNLTGVEGERTAWERNFRQSGEAFLASPAGPRDDEDEEEDEEDEDEDEEEEDFDEEEEEALADF